VSDIATLVIRAMAGDRIAEDALVAQLRPGVIAVLKHGPYRRWIEPEDLAQEALRVLVERLRSGGLHEPEKVTAFLAQTARKLALNAVRKVARQQTVVDSELVDETALSVGVETSDPDDERLAHAVVSLLEGLSNERDRYLLQRFYIDGVDKPSLCKELHLSHAHFDRLLFRARSRFRLLLSKEMPDFGLVAHLTTIVMPVALFAGWWRLLP
jgi:RNA polymerase sigma-70 factor, ECF subfamily